MYETVIEKIRQAKNILTEATEIGGISYSVKSILSGYAKDLDGVTIDLGGKWATMPSENRRSLSEITASEMKVIKLEYERFKQMAFSEKDVGDFLKNSADRKIIPRRSANRYGHTHRLYVHGLVSQRRVEGREEYKFNQEADSLLGNSTVK